MRCDLLEAMGHDAAECLYVGKVMLESGEPAESFRAVRAKRTLFIRGTKDTGQRICPTCGVRIIAPLGKEHLMACDLSPDLLIYGEPEGRLILAGAVFRRLKTRRWRDIVFKPLPVREVPADGLPAKLSLYTRRCRLKSQ